MSQGRMEFGMNFGAASTAARRRDDEASFRVLVVADLGGSAGVPLAQRKPLRVDIDNFDQVLARIAPRRQLVLDGQAVELAFTGYDDFHPDALYRRLPAFAALQRLREEAGDPKQVHRVAVALGLSPADVPAPQAPAAPAAQDDTIERLLGRKASAPAAPGAPASAAAGGFDMEAWIRATVAPHVVPDATQEQRVVAAALDSALAGLMRSVLHAPAFQALEANWRAVDRLVREVDWGENQQLFLLDASREDIEADLAAASEDLGRSALYRVLCGPATLPPDGQPWSLVASDLAIGGTVDDVRLMAVLGAMAGKAGAPWLAGARPEVLGLAGGAAWGEPSAWAPEAAPWQALRRSQVAPWIGLAGPRVLMRLPHGRQTDPIASFPFEELPAQAAHEAYLWGPPGLALALLAARAFQEDGWDLRLESQLHLTDLPSHVVQVDGEARQKPGAEWLISEPAGEAVLARGVMPLMSYRNRDAVRLLRWQSIAEPAQALQGPWA